MGPGDENKRASLLMGDVVNPPNGGAFACMALRSALRVTGI